MVADPISPLRAFHSAFLRTRGVRGALAYTERVVYLALAHNTPAPPHSSLASLARAAAVLPCELSDFVQVRGIQSSLR